jgi:iron complex outermembrane receptor protein
MTMRQMTPGARAPSGLNRGTFLSAGTLAAILLATSVASHAQNVLEEITVTAQKREQSIQDVGLSVTAFSGDDLKEYGLQDSFDVARMTPGVHISGNNGGQKTLFTIRGVTQNDFNDQTEAPVAVYIDEGYVGFGQGQVFGMVDLERVEVLKGPQGTLFGRNATGGLVHFISRRPTDVPEGYVDAGYGSYDNARVEAAISGPLGDNLSARMAVMYNRFDEILDNDYPNRAVTLDGQPLAYGGGEDTFNDDTLALRGQLLFEPTEDAELLVIGTYGRTRVGTSPFLELPTVPIFDAAGNHVGTIVAEPGETREAIAPDGTPINHPFSFDADLVRPPAGNLYGPSCSEEDYDDLECSMDFAFEDLNETDAWGVQGKLTWDFENVTLTSVSDFKDFDKFQGLPADGGPASTINVLFEAEAETFTQELRLNGELERWRWVAGAYYLNIDLNSAVSITADDQDLFMPLLGAPWEDTAITDLETDSWSLFGQVEYDLTDTLTLIGGLRAIWESKDFTGEETFFLSTDPFTLEYDLPVFSPQPATPHETDDTLWSGKAQLDWHATDDLLLYFGVHRGVKAGGFNAAITFGAGFPQQDVPYGEEILVSYEGGFKWDNLFGGTTRLNGSFYYYDYKDYQGFFFTQVTGFVRNVDAEYTGMELELYSTPADGFDFSLGLSLIDAEVYDVQLGPGIFVDSEPSFTPDTQLSGTLRYEWPQDVFGGTIAGHADFNYAASFYDNIRNFDASKLPSYVIGNLRLDWTSADAHWRGSLFVNNVADERYFTIGYDLSNATGSNSLVPGKPRWFGVSMRYSF